MFMSPTDQRDCVPHPELSDRALRELQARAETTLSELRPGRLRGSEITAGGYRAIFTTKAAAICAAALLGEELLDLVSIRVQAGRWVASGAWKVEVRS